MTPGNSLSDAPTYTQLTETWAKDGSATAQAITSYSSQPNASPRTVSVTNQTTGLNSIQYSYNAAGQWNDGLVYYDVTKDGSNNTLQSSSAVWQEGAYYAPRPLAVSQTDERNQTTGQEFSYGTNFNQVTEVREYGYGYAYGDDEHNPGRLRRRTTTEYETNSAYLWNSNPYNGGSGRHIFNLPKKVEKYAGSEGGGVKLARTEYQYDGQTLIEAQSSPPEPGVVAHDPTFNPAGVEQVQCCVETDEYGQCVLWDWCEEFCYNASTGYRGNVTQVKTWAEATIENDPNAVTETRQYDITGNLRLATTACCQQMSYEYIAANHFAYPASQTRGASDANNYNARVTTSAVYDFNTGLATSGTDADGHTGKTTYDTASLRPLTVYHPLTAPPADNIRPRSIYTYDDTAMQVTETTYLDASTVVSQNLKLLNGQGQVRQEQALGVHASGSQWDCVDTGYDNLGRTVSQTRPYQCLTAAPIPTTTTYDVLGRAKTVRAPDSTSSADGLTGGSVTEYWYNEAYNSDDWPDAVDDTPGQTTRIRDAWGRERWGRTDADGRLAQVIEPNPSGDGAVKTAGLKTQYVYDALGRLTQTKQFDDANPNNFQERKFQYDSLGRLTRQKLAETEATLNDAGNYVGAGGVWSDAFVYDLRSNLTQRADARGVKAHFSYNSDPLNRLQSVSYDTTGDPNHALTPGDANYYKRVQDAATVTYAYRTRQNANDLKDVTETATVTANGVSAESYSYDGEGRVSQMTLTLNNRSNYPLITGYLYDNLDRVTDVYYPGKNLANNSQVKVVHHAYDIAGRLSQLQVDGVSYASNIQYNAASQTTALNIGPVNANQVTETYLYNADNGLLTQQQATRNNGATTLLDLSYNYAHANAGNHLTGALVNLTDNRDNTGNHNRSYVYDALGRLAQAKGGPASPLWTQNYSYDRYGNRTTVTATGNAAGTPPPACAPTQTKDVEQFVKDFYQRTLQRQPTSAELNSWTSQLRQSYYAGATALNQTVAYLGRTLFKAQEYINLGRTDTQFVTDLYWAFLQRAPDTGGLNWWVSQVPGVGRDAVRDAFANDPWEAWARNGEICPRTSNGNGNTPIPLDGLASLSYDKLSNRITTAGFEYDADGNQRRIVKANGAAQKFQYDATNRLVTVLDDYGYTLQSITYGSSNQRLMVQDGDANSNYRTYYAGDLAEYVEMPNNPTVPQWSKTSVYLGESLLATIAPNGAGEYVQYHHPDRLGTRLITNGTDATTQEQVALPYGTGLDAESTGVSNKRFTSYDRSGMTGLDYAVNRHYDSQQGRFTQVDPIKLGSASLSDPQSLNLYSYVGNDPINRIDPEGLFWGRLFKKLFQKVVKAFVSAAQAFVMTFLSSGFNLKAALIAAGAEFVKALLTKPTFPVGKTTPGWNPLSLPILSAGVSSVSSYIIYNFTNPYAKFPCPPSYLDILGIPVEKPKAKYRGLTRVGEVLNETWEAARVSNVEEGGWIYMDRRGALTAVRKNRTSSDGQAAIYLDNPTRIRGKVVVASFHTHDVDSEPSKFIPMGKTKDGSTYGIPGDDTTNASQRIPGIILGGTGKTTINYAAFTGYGPLRGFFKSNLPKKCQ